jgi:hypothetical protein
LVDASTFFLCISYYHYHELYFWMPTICGTCYIKRFTCTECAARESARADGCVWQHVFYGVICHN